MYIVILNPASGRGQALRRLPEIEETLKKHGLSYEIRRVLKAGDAIGMARVAARETPEGIIAVGGDGTLLEIVNGMAPCDIPLIIVSCGTGNDFVRMLNLPKDPVEALAAQLEAPIKAVDLGRMNDTWFLNVSGTGLDVDVLRNTEKYKASHTGLSAYMRGLRDAVKHYAPMRAQISIDGAPVQDMRFAILSVGNGRYIGGGMRAVPDAIIDDGLFDLVIVKPVKRWMILPLIVLFVNGWHVRFHLGRVCRCKTLSISCDNMTLNLDGELQPENKAVYRLYPGALKLHLPTE